MKKIIPLGERILVKRRKIGDKLGSVIVAAEETADRPTDLADVVYIPEHSFADRELIENAEPIIQALTKEASDGDSDALEALLRYNQFLKIKSIRPGMQVMISKYVGTDFHSSESRENLTVVESADIIGIVRDE